MRHCATQCEYCLFDERTIHRLRRGILWSEQVVHCVISKGDFLKRGEGEWFIDIVSN